MRNKIDNIPDKVDVLVAGAGPAGLAASLELSWAGVEVVAVDSRIKIGHPLRCGEVTTDRYFKFIGIEPRPEWVRSVLGSKSRMIALNRERCEHGMAQLAREAGAIVVPGVSVAALGEFDGTRRRVTLVFSEGKKEIEARCVIAADGVASSVARLAGFDTYVPVKQMLSGLAYRIVDVRLRNPLRFIHEPLTPHYPAYPYYFWVIPNGTDEANVGLAIPGHHGNKARELLHLMMARTNAYKGGRIVQEVVGMISETLPIEKPYADGIMVVGGAARFVDPTTGGGLWAAVLSGREAAKTFIEIGGASATEDRLAYYRQRIDTMVYARLLERWEKRRIISQRVERGLPFRDDRF